jgi:hypothetical protein
MAPAGNIEQARLAQGSDTQISAPMGAIGCLEIADLQASPIAEFLTLTNCLQL